MNAKILFVTNRIPPDRLGAFTKLNELIPIQLALFGGRNTHATQGVSDIPIPHLHVDERDIYQLARRGGFAAAVCGTAGRVALPATWFGAKKAGIPFILWSALWATPRSIPHLLGTPLLHKIYRDAHVVVTYGPHASKYAKQLHARKTVIAPQAVDQTFWCQQAEGKQKKKGFHACFVGRSAPGKGVELLCEAWKLAKPAMGKATLTLIGPSQKLSCRKNGIIAIGQQSQRQVRSTLASADVLVLPSTRTKTFREPWGLVINEAMHLGVPVIASNEVGAVAGGLVRHNRNGFVVQAADKYTLTAALIKASKTPKLLQKLGEHAQRDAASFTQEQWAKSFARTMYQELSETQTI